MSIMNFWKKSFDFKVGSGRFRFGSFLNDRLKWSVRVVSGMLKVGTLLLSIDYKAAFSCILTCQIKKPIELKVAMINTSFMQGHTYQNHMIAI